ncbi:MAG: hypothetical protein J1G38_01000 [Clostridiales bacterium]|nr:hypothetical protein [Clostridiales bacterium]
MKQLSDKENMYKKIRRITAILGYVVIIGVLIFVTYLIVAIKVFNTSYLYLAIGVPIIFFVDAILILVMRFLTKKEQNIKSDIYKVEKLTTTNPLFQQVIEEYYYNQLEDLDQFLGKKWKVVDIDDYNNSIAICIKRRHGMSIEVEISETSITIMGESANSEDETTVSKNFTSDNFSDISSVFIYIADTCKSISNVR